MPREYKRSERVAELIRRAVAPLMTDFGRAQCDGLLSVTSVTVSSDLKHATVFVSCLKPSVEPRELVRELMHHAREVRHHVAKSTVLRSVPEIVFRYDSSLEDAARMNRLLKSLD